MCPPADPWGFPIEPYPADPEPTARMDPPPPPQYGRASVPPPREPTSEWPVVPPPPRRPRDRDDARELGRRAMSGRSERRPVDAPRAPMPVVSWQRASPASRRMLFDGWGFTATGLLIAFCGWGVWAAAGGGESGVPPIVGLLIVVAVGAMVFAVLRLASRVLFERMMGRRRPHARWAHFLTGLYLTIAGVSYFANSNWIAGTVSWVQDQVHRL